MSTPNGESVAVLTVPDCGICQAPMGLAPCPHLARVDGRAVCSEEAHDLLVEVYLRTRSEDESPFIVRDNCGHYINQFVCRAPFSMCGYHTRDADDFRQHLAITGHTGTDPQLNLALLTPPHTASTAEGGPRG